MYNQPFYIPRFYGNYGPMMMNGITRGSMMGRGNLFSRIGSLFSGIKNYNWSGLINNTSKTLGVINQAIPVVKQVKPVMNNVKSMIKIASIFKDETDSNRNENKVNNTVNNSYSSDESPTFFI